MKGEFSESEIFLLNFTSAYLYNRSECECCFATLNVPSQDILSGSKQHGRRGQQSRGVERTMILKILFEGKLAFIASYFDLLTDVY